MSSEEGQPPKRTLRTILLGGTLLVAALGGAAVTRLFSSGERPPAQRQSRPIVEIVRQQPVLPDLSDVIDRLCPSIAAIVPRGSSAQLGSSAQPAIPASALSTDGWLVTSGIDLPQTDLDAVFGDNSRVQLTDLRIDPVSGLAILKTVEGAAPPLQFSDQAFPRVGQFGLALTTQSGTGCSANIAMISSDFLADGGGPVGYVRLQSPPERWSAGVPFVGSDGRVLGIGVGNPTGAIIPAPVASVILDELIRDSLSPATGFGFRAIDYASPFSARLGNVRSGAGVALVRLGSGAARAGLQAGDIVTAIDETPISSASELSRALDQNPRTVSLSIQRRSQQLKLTLKRDSNFTPAE